MERSLVRADDSSFWLCCSLGSSWVWEFSVPPVSRWEGDLDREAGEGGDNGGETSSTVFVCRSSFSEDISSS